MCVLLFKGGGGDDGRTDGPTIPPHSIPPSPQKTNQRSNHPNPNQGFDRDGRVRLFLGEMRPARILPDGSPWGVAMKFEPCPSSRSVFFRGGGEEREEREEETLFLPFFWVSSRLSLSPCVGVFLLYCVACALPLPPGYQDPLSSVSSFERASVLLVLTFLSTHNTTTNTGT